MLQILPQIKRYKESFILIVLGILSLIFTIYISLNAYEQVFFQDIAYLKTLRPVVQVDKLNEIYRRVLGASTFSGTHQISKDNIRFLNLSSIEASIEVTHEMKKNEIWYLRGNKSHQIRIDGSNDLIIYFDQTWRTTLNTSLIKENELLFLVSNDSNYIFKIDKIDKDINNFSIKSEETGIPRIVIFADGNEYFIITATLVNSVRR
jgi:hypothetical protein